MAVVTIKSNDPMLMYWRMVFYGAAEPGARLIPKGVDAASGAFFILLSTLNWSSVLFICSIIEQYIVHFLNSQAYNGELYNLKINIY